MSPFYGTFELTGQPHPPSTGDILFARRAERVLESSFREAMLLAMFY